MLTDEDRPNPKNKEDGKKTFRLKHYKAPIQNPVMIISRKYKNEDNIVTFGITEIDEKFDLLKKVNHCRRSRLNDEICLNSEDLWDELFEELDPYYYCKKIDTEWNKIYDILIYRVPIKEHKTIHINNKEHEEINWIKYNNNYYDINKIYIINHNNENQIQSISELCDQKLLNPKFKDTGIQLFGLYTCNFRYVSNNGINKLTNSDKFIWTNQIVMNEDKSYYNNNDHYPNINENINNYEIIIDLKNIETMTHIGILPPSIITKKEKIGKRIDTIDRDSHLNKKSHNNDKNDKCLTSVINDTNQPWVSQFRLWYKDPISENWIYINEFRGNNDYFSMNLIELSSSFNISSGLQCRFLKMNIKSYHINPSFRLSFYGKEKRKIEKKNDDFVEYEIKFTANNTKKVPDDNICGHDYWRKRTKKNDMKNILINEMKKNKDDIDL
jgi:hypothetical protein